MKTAAIRFLAWVGVVLVPMWADPAAQGITYAPQGAPTTQGAASAAPAASLSPAPASTFRDLFADATDTHFWVAHVVKNPDGITEQTVLLWRPKVSSNGVWTEMPPVEARVVGIATSGGELLLVLENGQWEIADETDTRSGPSPPIGQVMLAIANDEDSVWGIVRVSTEFADTEPSPATTSPDSPSPTSTVSVPATQPAEHGMFLCQFSDGQWINPQPLPDGVSENPAQMSLAVVNQTPMLAWRTADVPLCVSKFDPAHGWTRPIPIAGAPESADFKLMTIHGRTALWLSPPPVPGSSTTQPSFAGLGEIRLGDNFAQRVALPMPTTLPSNIGPQTLVEAYGNLRWLAYAGDQQIEQDFSLEAFPQSFPAAKMSVVASPKPPVIPLAPWMTGNALLVALAAMAALRQRSASTTAPIDAAEVRRRLAPLGVRFIAGMVDLAPILAVVAMVNPANTPNALANVDAKSLEILFELALATYLLHTLIAELICGQSIGKMVFGLRAVASDGSAPKSMAILLRNLSRIIDLSIAPLLLVPLSPLRQRVGDILATTVVIAREGEGDGEE